jgi:hypothetical protein
VAAAFLALERAFLRLIGWQQFWMPQAYLDESKRKENLDQH